MKFSLGVNTNHGHNYFSFIPRLQVFGAHPAASSKMWSSYFHCMGKLGPNFEAYWHVIAAIRLLGKVDYVYVPML